MFKHTIILITTLSILQMSACKNSPKTGANDQETKIQVQNTTPTGPTLPGVPGELMSKLLNECTGIDYMFHDLPFSLNQDEKPSIIRNIGYLDINKPVGIIPSDCKPIGRKFYKINADLTYDADIYLSGKCKFYVFIGKDNKPMYANYMTDEGVKFYANTAQQARQTIK